MARRIVYSGKNNQDDSLVVGNHGPVQIVIKGDFYINGLVYCPKHRLQIYIKGNGRLALRGICKKIDIIRVNGNCVIDLEALKLSELELEELKGHTELIIGNIKQIRKGNIDEEVLSINSSNKVHYTAASETIISTSAL
ncbi:hypothetical protein [Pseudochryseolinea flava]|uniref:Uncharacterized protein n=1 Tax=Pseudochryseolinea flava TaxID=2059302 RepID=A0A364Y193_9BACT|nr:hypothetical protein [Pseudochryseolinea flava]RAW00593.1 hypothetical protein DQQ10_13440 [Pseudochryseolinea flava]